MENSSALKFIGAVGLGILAYVLAKSAAFATSIGILGAIIGFIICLFDEWCIEEINKNRRRINDLEDRLDKLEK